MEQREKKRERDEGEREGGEEEREREIPCFVGNYLNDGQTCAAVLKEIATDLANWKDERDMVPIVAG